MITSGSRPSRVGVGSTGPVFGHLAMTELLLAVAVIACSHEEHPVRTSEAAYRLSGSLLKTSPMDPTPASAAGSTCTENGDCRGFGCCGGKCANVANDPHNCGKCGVTCAGKTPYCAGSCIATPCTAECERNETCCGASCCGAEEICCMRTIGPSSPHCTAAELGTCPKGCAGCE